MSEVTEGRGVGSLGEGLTRGGIRVAKVTRYRGHGLDLICTGARRIQSSVLVIKGVVNLDRTGVRRTRACVGVGEEIDKRWGTVSLGAGRTRG
jgi:hypothetical protein